MTTPLDAAMAIIVGGLIGAIAHELTHYGVARLCGYPTSISWRDLTTYWRVTHTPRLSALVAAAPFLVGLGAIGLVLAMGSVLTDLGVLAAWLLYTFGGVHNDLPRAAHYYTTNAG